jgi:hypothetical protein
MRLLDSVVSSRERLSVILPGRGTFTLPNAADIAANIASAPLRYVLEDAVAASATLNALDNAEQVLRCLDLIRVPAPLLWVEWNERGRTMALSQLGLADDADARRTTGRAGLLVESDQTGRRGTIRVAWEGEVPEPDLSPFTICFDLDKPRAVDGSAGSVVRQVQIRDSEPLTHVLRFAQFQMKDSWRDYYAHACSSPQQLEEAIQTNLRMIAGDFPAFLSFLMLMQARNAVSAESISMTRLNKARRKLRRDPLLDHIEVRAALGGSPCGKQPGYPSSRADSRLHFVCGHLVRRGSLIFWRRAHLRGSASSGVLSSRTVVVKLAA